MSEKYAVLVKNAAFAALYFREMLPSALEVKSFGRKRVLIYFASELEAQQGLLHLQQQEFNAKKCAAMRFYKSGLRTGRAKSGTESKPSGKQKSDKVTQTNIRHEGVTALPKISAFVRKLYAVDADLGFEQPPAPYLKYAYPKVTPDIVDAISIELMTNTRFYTQVLHLMNRMNLEPPFGVRNKKAPLPGRPREASTQTADTGAQQVATLANSESELETSENEDARPTVTSVKRKLPPSAEQYKKKARLLLQAQVQQTKSRDLMVSTDAPKPRKAEQMEQFFEPTAMKSTKIALNVRTKVKPLEFEKAAKENEKERREAFVPPTELSAQQLTKEQMEELPVYKNYSMGVASNKLYIKNLAKEATVEDLLALYARYVKTHADLELRVMQQGRMKGQAFVTFLGNDSGQELVVARALQETNGFLLHGKPMVVCYGKK